MKNTLLVILISCTFIYAQNVTITPGGITPVLSGTYPRIAYDDILALPSPTVGDMAYDITFLCMRVYNGTRWVCTYQLPDEPVADGSIIASAGGADYDYGKSIAVDSDGGVYVLGSFQGTAVLGAVSIISTGGNDLFIAKYDANGALQWVQSAGGTSYEYASDLAVDISGNVYITGNYSGTTTFGAVSKTSVGSSDIFIAKYNSSGTLQWLESVGGTSNDYGNAVALDVSGNVYITGYYYGTTTFGVVSKTSVGANDVFIAKYDSNGTLQWVQSAGGTSSDYAKGIAVDVLGKVYITGDYQGTTTFGVNSTTSKGSSDVFIAKYDPVSVAWSWLRSDGGSSSDYSGSVAIDGSGNVYFAGRFYGTATFGGVSRTSEGISDIFIAKYNSSGYLQWVRSGGGTLGDRPRDIAVDASGNAYVTGDYIGTATFGTISKTTVGSVDIFIAKYNSSGILQWLRSTGGTLEDNGYSIALSGDGDIFVIGSYEGKIGFGATSKTSAGGSDVFLGRISQ